MLRITRYWRYSDIQRVYKTRERIHQNYAARVYELEAKQSAELSAIENVEIVPRYHQYREILLNNRCLYDSCRQKIPAEFFPVIYHDLKSVASQLEYSCEDAYSFEQCRNAEKFYKIIETWAKKSNVKL